jgi:hypothetical protein
MGEPKAAVLALRLLAEARRWWLVAVQGAGYSRDQKGPLSP